MAQQVMAFATKPNNLYLNHELTSNVYYTHMQGRTHTLKK